MPFGIVGIANTFVDLSAFYCLVKLGGVVAVLANVCSTTVAALQSYLVNDIATFRCRFHRWYRAGPLLRMRQ